MSEDVKKLSEEVIAEYTSSLTDLTFNSKPLINMLTMLAEENIAYAREIVEAIEKHLLKVETDVKLPILYLIDCIVKNVGSTYTTLFSQNIVSTFCNVFKVVDEKTRGEMFKLRQTWNEVFPQKKLYAIDVQVSMLDPAWPVSAQPPSNSIHFNPKFLKNTTNPTKELPDIKPIINIKPNMDIKPIVELTPLAPPNIPTTTPQNLDPETLSMQQKLIQKQRELLELQQKKLELELLQNQMKLQEQIHGNTKKMQLPHQNIIIKREVANHLMPHLQTAIPPANLKARPAPPVANATMMQRMQQSAANATPGTKISPVSSQLLSAKPIRDPRILRQQQLQQQKQQPDPPQQKQSNSNTSSHIESKSAILDSNNKIVNSKLSVGDNSRTTESRLLNNKDSLPSHNKVDIPRAKSSRSHSQKPYRPHRQKPPTSSDSDTKSLASSKGSSSSLDSIKSKSDRSDSKLSKSPSKHKKKDSPMKAGKESPKESSKRDRNSTRETSKSHKSESASPTTFKGVKGSKNRNYIRRNRSPSPPEQVVKDVDLRLSGPPEKHARLQCDVPEEKKQEAVTPPSQTKDVDLRQIPPIVNKKRQSTEATETAVTPKKSKTEMLDELFGNEDTDLRKLPIIPDRPKTPPPPIISSIGQKEVEKENKESPKKPSNLDAVRAKLAMATSKSNILSKSFHKNRLMQANKDEDLRTSSTSDLMNKIIISPEEEKCIKEGNMSSERSQQLMSKIFAQIETQKLREAQKKDKEDSLIMNTSLQPISDDELESNDSEEDILAKPSDGKDKMHLDIDERMPLEYGEHRPSERSPKDMSPGRMHDDRIMGDKDERIPPMHMPFDDMHSKYGRDGRELRRGPNWRGNRRRHWDSQQLVPHGRQPIRGRSNPPGNWRPLGPPNPFGSRNPHPDFIDNHNNGHYPSEGNGKKSPEIPENLIVESVNNDDNKTMFIDGVPREIRCYGETAVVFMNWDDPREISFQDGSRRVIFGEQEIYLLYFNQPAKDVMINGAIHAVKLGAPTREIFIDGKPYECYFGGPGIMIDLNGKPTSVKLEGPPPQVKIGTVKRTDLVVGKISLIIDAKIVVPIFVDAKVQKFVLNGETHTLKFIDSLKSVLINDMKLDVEFGGLPKPTFLQGKKYFIRFTVLPKGVKPGHVYIQDMEGCRLSTPPLMADDNSQDAIQVPDTNEPALPVISKRKKIKRVDSPDSNSNTGGLFQNLLHNPNMSNLDVLSSHLMSSMAAASTSQSSSGYRVENVPGNPEPQVNQTDVPAPKPVLPLNLDINELFQKLVATGIVTTNKHAGMSSQSNTSSSKSNNKNKPIEQEKPGRRNAVENLKPVSFDRPDSLKVRQSMLYDILYSGMQCSSCGMRFPPEQSILYSQHLDWHFRQNRKGKKNTRVAASRQWYYAFDDWKNYEEIEDLDEREKNYFDQQQVEGMVEEAEEETEIPSVPALPDVPYARCEVCMEIFDQFFNEEKEEWHLRNAIRVEDKTYHPVCYEDYLASLEEVTLNDTTAEESIEPSSQNADDVQIPGLEVVTLDDDDDEEPVQDNKQDQATAETSEESKTTNENSQEAPSEQPPPEDDGDDDDVIIHEVIPEKIIVDDDDDDDEDMRNDENSNLSKPESISRHRDFDDGFMDVEEALPCLKTGLVKVKSEPVDKDDLPVPIFDEEINALPEQDSMLPEEPGTPTVETPPSAPGHVLVASMDGNVEPVLVPGNSQTAGLGGKIKINISKPLSVISPRETVKDSVSESDSLKSILIDPSQPLPPGEEPVQLNLKPALQGIELKKYPPVQKGSELTGMCSIM